MDPDPNLDPKFPEKSDPDPKKKISDPQHCMSCPPLSPVGILEDFLDLETLGGLGVADHVLGCAHLDEGEARLLGQGGGQGSFT